VTILNVAHACSLQVGIDTGLVSLLLALGTVCFSAFVIPSRAIILSFRVSSDTLPTEVNLHRWKAQSSVQNVFYVTVKVPPLQHILSGCPVALAQNRYTYQHNLAFQCLAYQFIDTVSIIYPNFADLPNLQASVSTSSHNSTRGDHDVTSYHPDLVFYNAATNLNALLELDSKLHLQSARSC